MAFENVFRGIDFMAPVRAQQARGNQLQQAIGQGIAMYERGQDRELQGRQLDIKQQAAQAKAAQLDLSQRRDEALLRKAMGIPPTPEDEGVLRAADMLAQSKPSVDVYGNVRAGTPFASALGQGPAQLPQPIAPPQPAPQLPPVSPPPALQPLPMDQAAVEQAITPPGVAETLGITQHPSDFDAPAKMGAFGEKEELSLEKAIAQRAAGSDIDLTTHIGKKKIDSIYADMELTKVQKNAQNEYEKTLGQLLDGYEQFMEAGAGIETLGENFTIGDVARNIGATIGTTEFGHKVGAALGTKGAAAINKINSSRPIMFGKLRTAMGLTGKELDTKSERDFYMKTITSPDTDMETNLRVMRDLSARYGDGSNVKRIDAALKRMGVKKGLKDMSPEERFKDYQDLINRMGQ